MDGKKNFERIELKREGDECVEGLLVHLRFYNTTSSWEETHRSLFRLKKNQFGNRGDFCTVNRGLTELNTQLLTCILVP